MTSTPANTHTTATEPLYAPCGLCGVCAERPAKYEATITEDNTQTGLDLCGVCAQTTTVALRRTGAHVDLINLY